MTASLLRENVDHPSIQGFLDRSDAAFAAAEASAGFIARSRFPEPGDEQIWGEWVVPTIFQPSDYPNRLPPTLSLWRDLESVFAFAYSGLHAEALNKRREWFIHSKEPGYVAWWVDDDHIPNWAEACARYDKLQRAGASPEAFDFKHPFTPDGKPREALRRNIFLSEIGKSMTLDTTLQKYVAAWSEPDAAARQVLLEAIWSADGTYTDPMSHAANRAELDTIIAGFLSANPGATFTLNGKIDAHHSHVRFYWTLTFANGTQLPGMDYGEVALDGKLTKIVGFF